MKKTYCIDIDNTLCKEVSDVEEYPKAEPIKKMIDFVNELYDGGHTVYLYTGRHSMRAMVTKEWLDKHGVRYHHLYLGKPVADVYIDDRAVRFTNINDVKEQLNSLGML